MLKRAFVLVPAFLLAGCFDVDADFQVTKSHTLEGAMAFSMTPQAYDMFGDDADFCDEPFTFTGDAYRCADPMSFDFSADHEPTEHGPFIIQRISDGNVSVAVTLQDMTGNELPDDLTPDMVRSMFAGHAMIFRISGERIAEQQGGSVSDDGMTVIWRLPMAAMMLDEAISEMSAVIEY